MLFLHFVAPIEDLFVIPQLEGGVVANPLFAAINSRVEEAAVRLVLVDYSSFELLVDLIVSSQLARMMGLPVVDPDLG